MNHLPNVKNCFRHVLGYASSGAAYVFLTIGFWPAGQLPGQTVNQVLCAVQERKLVIAQRRCAIEELFHETDPESLLSSITDEDLIDWGSGLPRFPSAADVENLSMPETIKVLNAASRELENLAYSFVTAEETSSYVVAPDTDMSETWPHVSDASHEPITTANWRQGLKSLASRVRKLKAIPWIYRDIFTYAAGSSEVEDMREGGSPPSSPGFPFGSMTNWSVHNSFGGDSTSFSWEASGGGWEGQVSAGSSIRGSTGIRTRTHLTESPSVAPTLPGKVVFYKRLRKANGYFFSEIADYNPEFPVTHWLKIAETSSSAWIGSENVVDEADWSSGSVANDVANNLIDLWNIPSIAWNGVWTFKEKETPFGMSYWNYLYESYDNSQVGSANFSLYASAVFFPSFTSIGDDHDKAPLNQRPGNVDVICARSNIEICLGRGLNDKSEIAYLDSRLDGFGSPIIKGNASAYRLLYEKSASSYPPCLVPEKLNLPLFARFTEQERMKHGWDYKISYVNEWYEPRLRRIYGHDAVVDIIYHHDYYKELRFYPAGGVQVPEQNAESIPTVAGQPFKTVFVYNGTLGANEANFPTSPNVLRINDAGIFWEIEGEYAQNSTKFHIKKGSGAGQENLMKRTIEKDGYSFLKNIVEIGGQAFAMETDYLEWKDQEGDVQQYFGPDTAHPSPTKIKQGTREILINYSPAPTDEFGETAYHPVVTSISFVGDDAWDMNGAIYEFSSEGVLWKEKRKINNQWLETTHTWSKGTGDTKVCTSATLLDNQPLQTRICVLSKDLLTEQISINGEAPVEYKYHPTLGIVSEIKHPGDYRRKLTITYGQNDTEIRTLREGWGAGFSSGTVRTVTVNRWGGLISDVVTTSSQSPVTLSDNRGTDHSEWGIPKKLTDLRGSSSTVEFSPNGKAWGLPTRLTTSVGQVATWQDYDHLLRPKYINTGVSQLEFDYDDVLLPNVKVDGKTIRYEYNTKGELIKFEDTRNGGASLDLQTKNLSIDGRRVGLELTPAREITKIEGGLGNRGVGQKYSAESGRLCLTTDHLNVANQKHFETKTYFDGHGRVIEKKAPGPNGADIIETWVYNDANRSVTYTPPAGGMSQPVTHTLSADGSTLTKKEGNAEIMKQERSVANGRMVLTTTLMDDSSGGGTVARQVSKQEFEPSSGTSYFTPWDLVTAKETFASSVPGAQTTLSTSGGGGNDYRTVTLSQGRPSRVEGRSNGQAFDLNTWTYEHSRLKEVAGTIGGESVSLKFDEQGRVSSATGPGYDKDYTYGGAPGYTVRVVDSLQGISQKVGANAVGDFISLDENVSQPLTASSDDLADGVVETVIDGDLAVPGNLKVTTTATGEVKNKNYNSGGLVEARTYDGNGAIKSGGVGNKTNFTVTYGNDQQSITYGGGGPSLTEEFYKIGLRKRVSGSDDNRSFTWLRGCLASETHHGGEWNGASVRYGQDGKGRFNELVMEPAQSSLTVDYEYENTNENTAQSAKPSRPHQVSCGPLVGTYTYKPTGQLESFTRGPLVTIWGYDGLGRCNSVTTGPKVSASGVETFGYSYSYNARNLRQSRTTNNGLSWFSMGYDGRGRFTGWKPTNDPQSVLAYGYGYDTRNNVVASPAITFSSASALDQSGGKTNSVRSYGVRGRVEPGATVKVFHPLAPQGETLTADVVTGAYEKRWTVDASFGSGGVTQVDLLVRGTLTGAGNAGTDAVADKQLWVSLPAVNESLEYDAAGRLEKDGRWNYEWNGASHLERMVRETATIAESGKTSEVLTFTYDLDGRRTGKKSKSTYLNAADREVESKILWSGWLPVMEERKMNNQVSRRWFIWGRDVSGSWDGAGGVGGLAAIIEEGGRTLLPVEDGLGNIIAVVDQATGATVAKYDYSPYGELLSQSGEVDACPFRWQSKLYDVETGLYYFGYRYYDPKLCRWISRDPLGEAGGFNLYAYCGNDPVNKWDYLGLDPNSNDTRPDFITRFFEWLAPTTMGSLAKDPVTNHRLLVQGRVHRQMTVPILRDAPLAIARLPSHVLYKSADWIEQRSENPWLGTPPSVLLQFAGGMADVPAQLKGAHDWGRDGFPIIEPTWGNMSQGFHDGDYARMFRGLANTTGAITMLAAPLESSIFPRSKTSHLSTADVFPSLDSTIPGGLPNRARIIEASSAYYVLEYADGLRTVRFDAKLALQPDGKPAIKGGRSGTDETMAFITETKEVLVTEGLHRLNSVALEGAIVRDSVSGAVGWLEYDFGGPTTMQGGPLGWGVPMHNMKPVNPLNPWDGMDGY